MAPGRVYIVSRGNLLVTYRNFLQEIPPRGSKKTPRGAQEAPQDASRNLQEVPIHHHKGVGGMA